MLATWQRDALVALFPGIANATAALARPLAVTIHWITATPAHGHLAEITLPAGQALHIALLVARVVRVHLVLLRLLAGLPGGGEDGGGLSAREGEATYTLLPERNIRIDIDAARLTRVKVSSQRFVATGQSAGHHQKQCDWVEAS